MLVSDCGFHSQDVYLLFPMSPLITEAIFQRLKAFTTEMVMRSAIDLGLTRFTIAVVSSDDKIVIDNINSSKDLLAQLESLKFQPTQVNTSLDVIITYLGDFLDSQKDRDVYKMVYLLVDPTHDMSPTAAVEMVDTYRSMVHLHLDVLGVGVKSSPLSKHVIYVPSYDVIDVMTSLLFRDNKCGE